jgi:hypothetical protein
MAKTWVVSCYAARTRGALGIFYPVLIDYQADTAEAAEAQFREQYETHGPPVVVHERLHTAHPAPIPAPDETENG